MMDTRELISALGADTAQPLTPLDRTWMAAITLSVVAAAIVFSLVLGPRTDLAAAAHTVRFLFKFVVAGALAFTTLFALVALSRPEPAATARLAPLAIAPFLLILALVVELAVVPRSEWEGRMIGVNSPECLFLIASIAALPLAFMIWALRRGASTRPTLAGAIAGLAAGGIGASFYAAHCTDDSPLFVATWYVLAVGIVTAVGAVAGRAFVRW